MRFVGIVLIFRITTVAYDCDGFVWYYNRVCVNIRFLIV